MALAIQVTSCMATRLRSAVTSPPPPRLATRPPSTSRSKVTGPRLETTINFRRAPMAGTLPEWFFAARQASGSFGRGRHQRGLARVVAVEPVEEREPVAQKPRRQEMLTHVLLAPNPTVPCLCGVAEDLQARGVAILDGLHEPAGLAVLNLARNPAGTPRNRRPALPQAFRHRQAETLPDRLLQHCRRVHLEGVDLHRADVVQVREDEDVGIARGVLDGLVVEVPAFRVVAHDPESVDHAERVLPGIES